MAEYDAKLPDGKEITIDVPAGQDPAVYIPHAVQMISRQSTPSIGDRVGSLAKTAGTALANSPQSMLDYGVKTAGEAVTQPENGLMGFDLSHLLDVAKGAGRGASLGIYNPQGDTPEAQARMKLGELLGGGKLFGAAARIAKPLVGPALMRIPLVSSLLNAIGGGIQGGPEGAAAGAGQGLGVGIMGEGAAMAGKGLTRSLLKPGEQVLSNEEANTAIRQSNQQKAQASLDDLALRKAGNAEVHQQYMDQLSAAEADAAGTNAAAHEAFMKAREAAQLKLDQAKNSVDPANQQLQELAQRVKPNAPSADLYRPINEAIQAGTDPVINTPSIAASMEKIGGNIAKTSEGLPKAAGASGTTEKIATQAAASGAEATPAAGVDPVRSALLARAPENVKSYFGDAISNLSNESLQKFIDQAGPIADATGASVGDVGSMLEGKLKLGAADRLLQVFGKQSRLPNGGLAKSFFWDVIGDLKEAAKTEPMAQQLLDARASYRQEVAADQLGAKAAPGVNANGQFIYNPTAVKKMMNPTNPTKADVLFRDSFPAATRTMIMDTLDQVFHAKEAVHNATSEMRGFNKETVPIKDTAKFAKKNTVKPDYVSTEVKYQVPDPALEQQYVAAKGGVLEHPLVIAAATVGSINAIFGTNITYSIMAGGVVAIKALAPPVIFKLALAVSKQPAGRAFLTNLFRNEPPNIHNPANLTALLNFAGVEAGRVAAQTGKMGGIAGAAMPQQQQQPPQGMPQGTPQGAPQ